MGISSNRKLSNAFKWGFGIGTVVGIIVIGVVIITPQICCIGPTRVERYDSDTKANLHNVFLACKAYWADNGPANNCTPAIVSQPEYGYIQSADLNISANGAETDFSATAQNVNSKHTFSIDSEGTITEVDWK